MTARRVRVLFAAGFLSTSSALAAPPNERADALYTRGIEHMRAHDYRAACDEFRESLTIEPGVGVSLWLAECFDARGQTASAWRQFLAAASLASTLGDARERVARTHAEKLEPRLPRLAIRAPTDDVVPGLSIECDGAVVAESQLAQPMPVDPGVHTVRASAPGRAPWSTTAYVAQEPAVTTVTVGPLTMAPAPEPMAPSIARPPPSTPPKGAPSETAARPPPPEAPLRKTVELSLLGVAVAGVATGLVLGVAATVDKGISDEACVQVCSTRRSFDARNRALDEARYATIAFGVGGAAALGLAVSYLTRTTSASSPGVRVSLTPFGAVLHGSL